MPKIDELKSKAEALGFSFERGMKKGAGYVLVNDANGDRPLGHDYTASLADIELYLQTFAGDIGIDVVELGSSEPSKPPPTKTEIQKSIRGHDKAEQIKDVLKPSAPSGQESLERERRWSQIKGAREDWRAFALMSEAEKAERLAKAKVAKAEEERIAAAKLPRQKIPLRDFGNKISIDDPLYKERVRQNNVVQKANRLLFRTNLASVNDYESDKYREDAFENGLMMPDEVRAIVREENKNFLAPDKSAWNPAPKPATNFKLIRMERRISKADRPILQLRAAIRDAIARKDRPAAGAMLIKAKELLGHGAFTDWVHQKIGINIRTAERYMELAQGKAA
jgi:hypothetical protein